MDKTMLLQKIANKAYSHEQLVSWVSCLGKFKPRSPSISQVGDVYMHPVFLHPYVLLEKTSNGWMCALITSDHTCAEILEPCQSRFFTGNFFTKTIFTNTNPQGTFVNIFDNPQQVKDVYIKLKKLFGQNPWIFKQLNFIEIFN